MDKRVMDESQLRGRGKKKGDGFEWRIGAGKLSDTGIRETEVKTQDTKKKSKGETKWANTLAARDKTSSNIINLYTPR